MPRRNNLSYSAHTPTFLRRLRGELPPEPSASTKYSDEVSGDKAKDVVSDDETTVPEYIFKGETITKVEFEELQNGKSIDDIKADRLRRETKEKELIQAPDQTASSKPSANVSEFGSRAAKRKFPVKIRQTDGSDEENHEVATAAKRNKSVPDAKKKATKDERKTNGEKKSDRSKVSRVQLSFGDDDE
ncbi:hypothetical protein POJ06DRAFT_267495 [Lipomyces tetrasporus]|uniref:DUF4604 domain-containing protein n=1 Tax=Lipomyces tetrasporus TaxID=54092 RepID=A0AAD7QU13_9ASCO|nr:uncharacterized protein POJ06DRAFT_267495 [Lipomyces tetrasporus]KAJ8101339.1 hypothetical protein POJ06DRAFT_267495 [Lipomyces tetrasporus]